MPLDSLKTKFNSFTWVAVLITQQNSILTAIICSHIILLGKSWFITQSIMTVGAKVNLLWKRFKLETTAGKNGKKIFGEKKVTRKLKRNWSEKKRKKVTRKVKNNAAIITKCCTVYTDSLHRIYFIHTYYEGRKKEKFKRMSWLDFSAIRCDFLSHSS